MTDHFARKDFGSLPESRIAWLIALLCLLPFLPGLAGPFQLDDATNLARVQPGHATLASIYEALFNNTSGALRRPLSNASFLVQGLLGAREPWSYKTINLLIHGLNAWLVWCLASRLLSLLQPAIPAARRRSAALFATIVWTLHPLQVSSVLYIVQRMTLLSSTFMLLSMILALRPLVTSGSLPNATDGLRHALVTGLVVLIAVLNKETGVLVPFLLLATCLAMPRESFTLITDSRGKRSFLGLAIGLPVVLAVIGLAMGWNRLMASYAGRSFTVAERLISESRVLIDYAMTFVLPLPSRMGLFVDDQPIIGTATPYWWIGPVVVVCVLLGAVLLRRRYPMAAFAVFWFMACHLLESTIVPLELKYEHRNYLALLGPALWLGSVVAGVTERERKYNGLAVAVAITALLAGATLMRSIDWSSNERFIATELRHHPGSVRANMSTAQLESINGRNDLAYARTLAMQAAHPDSYAALANGLELGCAGFPIDWNRLHSYIHTRPADAAIENQALYQTLMGYVQNRKCAPGFDHAFTQHIDESIAIYSANHIGRGLQFFLMVKAQMQSEPQAARKLVNQAVAADPEEMGPLVQLAYLDLALGNFAQAQQDLDRLEHLVPRWHPKRAYVDEFARQLEQAQKPSVQAPLRQ